MNKENKPLSASDWLDLSKTILEERGKEYDPDGKNQERSMEKIVDAFHTFSGVRLTESEGWLFMLCLKGVRLFNKPGFHADSMQDLISYAALLAECKQKEKITEPEVSEIIQVHHLNDPLQFYSWLRKNFKADSEITLEEIQELVPVLSLAEIAQNMRGVIANMEAWSPKAGVYRLIER